MKSCAITEKISRMSVRRLIVGVPDASVASGGVANRCPTGAVSYQILPTWHDSGRFSRQVIQRMYYLPLFSWVNASGGQFAVSYLAHLAIFCGFSRQEGILRPVEAKQLFPGHDDIVSYSCFSPFSLLFSPLFRKQRFVIAGYRS